MSLLAFLSTTTGGARSGLFLLAVGAIIAVWHARGALSPLGQLRWWTAMLVAVSAAIYSPAHAAWLLGHPVTPVVARALDLLATLTASAALILLIGVCALARGVEQARVKRGGMVNAAIGIAFILLAWVVS